MTASEKVRLLLEEIRSPAPEGGWYPNYDFDPIFGRTELHAAEKRGLIEIERLDGGNHLMYRFRLTSRGRAYLERSNQSDLAGLLQKG